MSQRKLVKQIIACVFVITAFFYIGLFDAAATPCVVSFETQGAQYFEVELNGELFRVASADSIFKADLSELEDGIYQASVAAVGIIDEITGTAARSAPVHFTLFKQSRKNKCYYSIAPEPGYEQFFSEPLQMVTNIKAGKAIGK